ncbi:MAG TPA: DUF433 domain-containing protein [Methylomirabilota bacterium]|nr:DUF433 domain-containing protein [Methylomirabilota bacterium]
MALAEAAFNLYGDHDPREVAAYGITEAARYLDIPVSTLRSWTVGQAYKYRGEDKVFEPVIRIADQRRNYLSFYNLFEAYICDALRRAHGVSLGQIRAAIKLIETTLDPNGKHPLVDQRFASVGVDLFIEHYGELIGVKNPNQQTIRSAFEDYLKRVDRDKFGKVMRLYPFTRAPRSPEAPKVVVIDPTVMFGRPVIAGTRVATAMVYQRWKAGEGVQALAEDYARPIPEIEEALRCENADLAA